MNEMEAQLNPAQFIRIHRSTIININFIKEMQHWYKNDYIITLKNGEKFTSSNTYKFNIEKILGLTG
jgi:two-component system LytT family response regulator